MSIQQVYLEQGSREWHDHRLAHFNASEAALQLIAEIEAQGQIDELEPEPEPVEA